MYVPISTTYCLNSNTDGDKNKIDYIKSILVKSDF